MPQTNANDFNNEGLDNDNEIWTEGSEKGEGNDKDDFINESPTLRTDGTPSFQYESQ